jgi:aspartyl-tRNA(Asn)/glutamyl-tRNA(Gln) amidotransferase subunit A
MPVPSAAADPLNALTAVIAEERPRDDAPGPGLRGVRVAVKDNIDVAGTPTTNGLPGSWPVAERDAPVVARMRAAGARIVAKTNLSELALGATTRNRTFGDGRNPWSPDRVPGGSSGGSAAAVAAGLCELALGSDTGGSVRNPASICGVVGLRPTPGRISTDGMTALSHEHDTVGLLARDAELVAVAFATIARVRTASADLVGLRVGVPDRYFLDDLDGGIGARMDEAIAVLEDLRAQVQTVRLGDAEHARSALGVLIARDAARLHRPLASRPGLLDPYVHDRLAAGMAASAATISSAQRARRRWRANVTEALGRVDLIATPTVAVTPPVVGADPEVATRRLNRLTAPWSLALTPALSLPCGLDDDGMPVGLQLVARHGDDELLLRVACALQRHGLGRLGTARQTHEGGDHGRALGP